jgi:hypothetical protein
MRLIVLCLILVITGSAAYLFKNEFDTKYGIANSARHETPASSDAIDYWRDINPVLESRCVVCHACYDAGCQLKLSSFEGITRGITDETVYNARRILAAQPTRLFEDAHSVTDWRALGFSPVLNERENTPEANIDGSVMAQSLLLKDANPLPEVAILPDTFDFSLKRDQQCVKIEEFDQFKQDYPLWGMPYGLPKIDDDKQATLLSWLENGAPYQPKQLLTPKLEDEVAEWEAFFNQDSLKGQLVSRYMYEHLFQAHLYFDGEQSPVFFEMVRSRTAPGLPVERITTRVPFEDPKVERVFYRLQPVRETISVKNHQPYLLNAARQKRWQTLFYEAEYEVTELPSYEEKNASNPFRTFVKLPVEARYGFMLEEAQYTIMGFIKGPVCRGQTALNVINDHFWVTFIDPEVDAQWSNNVLFAQKLRQLDFPASAGSTAAPLDWVNFALKEREYLDVKHSLINFSSPETLTLDLDVIWDGGGHNKNAALTIFRHLDSASVVQGLVGTQPQSVWVINYSLLERIHYLLVAGYDVFGNLGHQLNTRIYMDFLRMEGETNFLALLPLQDRATVVSSWYRGSVSHLQTYLHDHGSPITRDTNVHYSSEDTLTELYSLMESHLSDVQNNQYSLQSSDLARRHIEAISELNEIEGHSAALLPEITFLQVTDNNKPHYFTILHHRAYTNISHMYNEADRRLPQEDRLLITNGFLGAYPNAFWRIDTSQIEGLQRALSQLRTESDYRALLDEYGVRRSDPDFWELSDEAHQALLTSEPIAGGLLDYNRLENR